MSNLPTPLYEQLLAYFRHAGQFTPPLIPHPDEAINRVASAQLAALRKAAVLIPVTRATADRESHIVLTVRSANLKNHAGQISLPGGTQEQSDTDVYATALRESKEEIGLQPRQVEVIGRLGEMLLPTGYRVTPVIGVIDANIEFTACPIEVADIFQAPLSLVLDPLAYRSTVMQFESAPRTILELTFEDYRIWGATAAILHHLALQVVTGKVPET